MEAKVLSIEKKHRGLMPFLLVTYRLDSGDLIYDCFAQAPNAKWRWDQFQKARKGRRVGVEIKQRLIHRDDRYDRDHGVVSLKTVWEIKRYVPPETLVDTAKGWVAYFIRGYLLPWLEKDK